MSEAVTQECNHDPVLKCLSCRRNFNIDVNKLDLNRFGGEFTETEMLCQFCTSALVCCYLYDKKDKLEKIIKGIFSEQLDRYEERIKLNPDFGANPKEASDNLDEML